MQYFHGTLAAAKQGLRTMALLWNFHPYIRKVRAMDPYSMSPIEDLNGFRYHENLVTQFPPVAIAPIGISTEPTEVGNHTNYKIKN
ncbi:hypothetical protein OsccyDRAFT_0030 [Leptolyngbyaceae cyanobacterium JSC-12]|nr:hypothetical protein OsccyDRAFT_0030 [Leptolyngbyaceae cyanobacterium JSC-12]